MNKRYTIIMLLSFIYGGFLLTSYTLTLYTVFVKEDVPGPLGVFIYEGVPGAHAPRGSFNNNASINQNVSAERETTNETRERANGTNSRPFFERRIDPMEALLSPYMLLSLFGGIICITNGLAVRQLTHEKEIKKLKADLADLYLSAEEKQVMEELNKASGELTQKNLTELTGFSRVKTHRIIQKLESKKLVRKIPNGQTNKILIENGQKPKDIKDKE
jgi:hypothetical protein